MTMIPDTLLLQLAPQLMAQQTPFAFATVIRAAKPTSAYVGAQAIIEADGTLHGWVGGGCARGVVVQAAQDAIRSGKPKLVRISNDGALTDADVENHAMPCASNGSIELFIQPVVPAPLLVVLGATPAAREACVLAQRMGLRVAAVTAAAELMVPDLDYIIDTIELETLESLQPQFVLVVTQGEGDETALETALRTSARAVLLIASARKAEALRNAMQLRGIAPERMAALHAPAGPYIHARTPAEVALGAIAAVVALRRMAEETISPEPVLRDTPLRRNAVTPAADVYVNPVCGMVVDPVSAKHVIEYGGLSHYFCCDGCKVSFEREPDKYLAIARQAVTPAAP